MRAARRIVVSALLGLPAALLAHALVFGQAHFVGGSLHGFALQGAAGFALLAALIAGITIVREGEQDAPHAGAIALSAAAFLSLIEIVEAPHAVPLLLCVLAVALAAAALACIGSAYAHAVAAILHVFGTHVKVDAPRLVRSFSHGVTARRRTLIEFSLFSRPPPILP